MNNEERSLSYLSVSGIFCSGGTLSPYSVDCLEKVKEDLLGFYEYYQAVINDGEIPNIGRETYQEMELAYRGDSDGLDEVIEKTPERIKTLIGVIKDGHTKEDVLAWEFFGGIAEKFEFDKIESKG